MYTPWASDLLDSCLIVYCCQVAPRVVSWLHYALLLGCWHQIRDLIHTLQLLSFVALRLLLLIVRVFAKLDLIVLSSPLFLSLAILWLYFDFVLVLV